MKIEYLRFAFGGSIIKKYQRIPRGTQRTIVKCKIDIIAAISRELEPNPDKPEPKKKNYHESSKVLKHEKKI